MKNVTISLDDETHRRARIRAAELGTSLSGLVKAYLNALARDDMAAATPSGVREVPLSYTTQPMAKPTPRPRKLGQMKGEIWYADDWETWPPEIQESFDKLYDGIDTYDVAKKGRSE